MPYQECPDRGSWLLWERLLENFCSNDSTLIQPLGSWLVSGEKVHRCWQSCYNSTSKKVFLYKKNEYEIYSVVNNKCYYDGDTVSGIPPDALPCRLDLTGEVITLEYISSKFHSISVDDSGDFQTCIETLPKWEYHLLRNVEMTADIFTTVQVFNNDGATLCATSDGSAPEFIGSFGWAMRTTKGTNNIATNNGAAPGYRTTSFRAEAYGLLSLVLFLYHAFKFTEIPMCESINLFSDSEGLIKRIVGMLDYIDFYSSATMQADWDVLQAIVHIVKTFTFPPNIGHVMGHQDNNTSYSDLKLEEQLNVDADKLAGVFMYPSDKSPIHPPMITGSKVALQSVHGTICSRYHKNIRKFSTLVKRKEYTCKKNN